MSIPNTLTIFINTRIRGSTQLRYKPYMTVPKEKGDKIYIDPLIKLNRSVVEYIPYGYPETELYTQFFNKNEFTSLIQRTLGVGSQKKRDLVTATKEGIIDKNIRITLDALFKSGNPFYIGSQKYTIYNYDWLDGDWEIQPVNSSKLKFSNIPGTNTQQTSYNPYMNINPYLYGQSGLQTNQYSYKKLNSIPASARTGTIPVSASKIGKSEILRGVRPVSITETAPATPLATARTTPLATAVATARSDLKNPLARATVTIKPNSALAQQFANYYNEGYKKGFIVDPLNDGTMTTSINRWTVIPNEGKGDCFFLSLRDLLNGHNKTTRLAKIIVPPYVNREDNLYTVKSLRTAVADYILGAKGQPIYDQLVINANVDPMFSFMRNTDGTIRTRNEVAEAITKCAVAEERDKDEAEVTNYYWGDAMAVDISEIIFNIKLVIIDINGNRTIRKGARVSYINATKTEDLFGRVVDIDRATPPKTADVQGDDYSTVKKNTSELTVIDAYTISCLSTTKNMKKINLYGFILYSGNNHYEAIYQNNRGGTISDKYIFNTLPSYIIYMIFVSCYATITDESSRNTSEYGLSSIYNTLKGLYDIYKAKMLDPKSLATSNKMLLGGANKKSSSSLKTKKKQGLVKKKTLKKNPLKAPPSIQTFSKPQQLYIKRQLASANNKKSLSKKNKTKKNIKTIPNPNLIKTPFQKYISNKYVTGYDSDLTYYIVIDLELYPGDNIPLSQKAVLACQNRYEKIRQSYADMFGYIYQPKEYVPPFSKRTGSTTQKNIPGKQT